MGRRAEAAKGDPKWDAAIEKGLRWVAKSQSSLGHWTAGGYPTAMTALAGTALVASGSTTIQGPYAKNIRKTVDYLLSPQKLRPNGLIGDPQTDNRYTYGHGFSMLLLSQVLGEEEDEDGSPHEVLRPCLRIHEELDDHDHAEEGEGGEPTGQSEDEQGRAAQLEAGGHDGRDLRRESRQLVLIAEEGNGGLPASGLLKPRAEEDPRDGQPEEQLMNAEREAPEQ